MPTNVGKLLSSAIVLGIASLAIWDGLNYPLGEFRRIGAGFFPVALGVVLFGLGIFLLFERSDDSLANGERPSLRAICAITAGMIGFALLLEPAGLAPAVAALVFISAYAEPRKLLPTALLAIGAAASAVGIFVYALGLPMNAFGGW